MTAVALGGWGGRLPEIVTDPEPYFMADTDLPPTIPGDIESLSFEEALSQLEDIVRGLEDGRDALDESITAYERGAQLKAHCEAKLKEAEARIEKIMPGAGGLKTEAANID